MTTFHNMALLLSSACSFALLPPPVIGQTIRHGGDEPARLPSAVRDVRYGNHPRNLLDFFPAESELPAPVLIYFHGGGFVGGDKEDAGNRTIVRDCLAEGVSVISANYRFVAGPDSEPFPGSLMDGVRVVQFVRSKANEWNVDAGRIVLIGSSAGAFMSLWIALHDDFALADSHDPLARQSSRVLGVVAYSSPTTVDPREITKHIGGNPRIHSSIFPIFDIKKIEELDLPAMRKKVEEFSPLSHVSVDDPPLQLRYAGTLFGTPLPADTNVSISIHHAKFGDLLRGRYKDVGSKQTVELVCTDCPDAGATEHEFLRRVFDLRVPKVKPDSE